LPSPPIACGDWMPQNSGHLLFCVKLGKIPCLIRVAQTQRLLVWEVVWSWTFLCDGQEQE
jgi:hypothetical protein